MEPGVSDATAREVSQAGLVLFDLAVRGRRVGQLLSENATALLELINQGARTFGREVLEARTAKELDARLESIITRPGFLRLHGRFATQVSRFELSSPNWGEQGEPSWLQTVFAKDRELFLQAQALLGAISEALITGIRNQGELVAPEAELAFIQPENPFVYILNPGVPKEVAQGMLRGLYAGACLFAVLRLARTKTPPKPALRRALLQRWCEHLYGYLRLLASLPITQVPEDVVPSTDRVQVQLS